MNSYKRSQLILPRIVCVESAISIIQATFLDLEICQNIDILNDRLDPCIPRKDGFLQFFVMWIAEREQDSGKDKQNSNAYRDITLICTNITRLYCYSIILYHGRLLIKVVLLNQNS